MNQHKITLLLIDDEATFTIHKGVVDLIYGCSENEEIAIHQNFNLIWLKNINEIKAYFDGVKDLKNCDSRVINTLGILPEIIIFDYCLTRGTTSQMDRLTDPTNPNVPLYQKLQKLRPRYKALSEALKQSPPKNVSRSGSDRYGLVSGALLFTFFFDYMTTGVPITAYSDIGHSPDEAGYIEWCLDNQISFDNIERPRLEWGQLLFESLLGVRDAMLDLVESGVIKIINIYDLIGTLRHLGEPPFTYDTMTKATIAFNHSIYGEKIFLLSALFFDHFFDGQGKTLLQQSDRNEVHGIARDSELITTDLKEIIDSALNNTFSQDEYVISYRLCMLYINAWNEGEPLEESLLTNRGYDKDRQKRFFLLAMVLLLKHIEIVDSEIHFRSLLEEVYFSGETKDAKRKALQKAGVKISEILGSEISEADKSIIRLHAHEVSAWPQWWKL